MRAGLLIILLIGLGCTGPSVNQPSDVAESHPQACPSRQSPTQREQAALRECPSRAGWWGQVGEALIRGAAAAVRTANP